MKFSEIVGLHSYFQPVYNIDNETGEYWKQFIPNDNFYDILDTTITAIQSVNGKDKLSLWIVGRYGTGKSHASGVIKHLLWDSIETIEDYLNDSLSKHSTREQVRNFRKSTKILPVVLVGGGNVTNGRTASLEIERALKKTLRDYNISIQTKSDFERMIDKVNDNFLNWNTIIEKNIELKMNVSSKSEIIQKLEKEDIELLTILENIFSEKGTHFSHEKISTWLKEVVKEIKTQNIADGIMIFWDEFTTILERDKISEILDEIQSIAELSSKDNVYLYLISHRDYDQFPAIQETMDKVKGRFHTKRYPMIPVTTYQILSAALQCKNIDEWTKLKQANIENHKITSLVNTITDNISSDANTKLNIKNLYPIHPYTAYLSTFLANNIGSTQRSIFNFLYDNKFGFTKFIDSEIEDKLLLTPDYLWDYYAEVLESDPDNRFMQVLERYNAYKQQIETIDKTFLQVFKGVLLLNALYRITDHSNPDTSKINPHIDNIKALFAGTTVEEKANEALKYLDEQEIIQKNPSNLYEIATTSLPRHEIDLEREKILNQYSNLIKVIEFEKNKEKLNNLFDSTAGILRETKVQFFSYEANLSNVKHNLYENKKTNLKASHTIDFAVFITLIEEDRYRIEKIINNLKKEPELKHITFIIIKTPFGERNYKDFIDYLARANVYRNHSFHEESAENENYAKTIVEKWITQIKYFQVFLNSSIDSETRDKNSFGKYVNENIAPKIFNQGVDILNIRTGTVWRKQNAKKAIEFVLTSKSRTEIETKPNAQYSYIKDVFKNRYSEYVISEQLEIKFEKDENHPVVKLSKTIEQAIEKVKTRATFNLATELEFLTKPPYGLYTNIPNMAILAFAMRPYVNQLYTASYGTIVDVVAMRDKLGELFEAWQNGKKKDKLNFRFGTQEEKDLIENLSEIFGIDTQPGIQQLRWKVKEKIKSIGFPLWSVKFTIDNNDQYGLKPLIDEISNLIFSLNDTEIDLELTNKILIEVKKKRIDLITVFNSANFEKGFLAFVSNIEEVKIEQSELGEVIKYIRKNQPEELNWKEGEVREKVKDWRLKQVQEAEQKRKEGEEQKRKEEILKQKQEEERKRKEEEEKNKKPKLEVVKRAKNKVNSYNGNTEAFKSKLVKIIDEHPDLAEILEKYFD